MTFPVADPVSYLTGRWSIARTLTDAAIGTSGTFTGVGVFTPDDTGLAYEEHGTLDLGHWRGESYRLLHYAPGAPGRMTVTFDDGRPFHDLDLRTGEWTIDHPCRADAYAGRFTAVSPDEWHQEWRVRGPAKNQLITSTFTRGTP